MAEALREARAQAEFREGKSASLCCVSPAVSPSPIFCPRLAPFPSFLLPPRLSGLLNYPDPSIRFFCDTATVGIADCLAKIVLFRGQFHEWISADAS